MKVGLSANVIQSADKIRFADFAPPSVARHWAERREIRSFPAGVKPVYSRIVAAADFVNRLIVGGAKAQARRAQGLTKSMKYGTESFVPIFWGSTD